MGDALGMLETVSFFAVNATMSGADARSLDEAYDFIRTNMKKLVRGPLDITLDKELVVL